MERPRSSHHRLMDHNFPKKPATGTMGQAMVDSDSADESFSSKLMGKTRFGKLNRPISGAANIRLNDHSQNSELNEPSTSTSDHALNPDIQELFRFISKYTPNSDLALDTKLKPFIPKFIPAVGDIDAFLKVCPPTNTALPLNMLGLNVLDEPSSKQSDSALLLLKMRAVNNGEGPSNYANVIVKTVSDVEKNGKIVSKWIKDISDLHKSKSSATMKYYENLPELDELLRQHLSDYKTEHNFELPQPSPSISLSDYAQEICNFFHIKTENNNLVNSLHLLFCLHAFMKNAQSVENLQSVRSHKENPDTGGPAHVDQLILE